MGHTKKNIDRKRHILATSGYPRYNVTWLDSKWISYFGIKNN